MTNLGMKKSFSKISDLDEDVTSFSTPVEGGLALLER